MNPSNTPETPKPTVGLFGTCGNSTWRTPFIETFESLGITYFNPQVPNWTPEFAIEEAKHLATDEIILFPITSETYAGGSLSEVGFSILQAIRLDKQRSFVVLIDKHLDPELMENQAAAKESTRSRALVSEHLRKLSLENLYWVDTLEEMLRITIPLHNAASIKLSLQEFAAKNKPR